jgi:hypothetical protein
MKTIAHITGVLAFSVAFAVHPQAQAGGERFTATASIKSPTVTGTAPVIFQINGFVSASDRDRLLAVVKGHKTTEIHDALGAMPDLGYVELDGQQTPIKYAYAQPTGSGRLISVVTAKPIRHIGAQLPDAKPKKGYDLAFALLILDANDHGDGEFAPATKIKMDDKGAIVTEDYGPATVHLTGIAKTK